MEPSHLLRDWMYRHYQEDSIDTLHQDRREQPCRLGHLVPDQRKPEGRCQYRCQNDSHLTDFRYLGEQNSGERQTPIGQEGRCYKLPLL